VVQPSTRIGRLDPPRHVELVAAERDDADRHAGCERLLGGALAAVADDASGVLDDRPVRQERL
jgi:hypothetical protein